MSAVETSHIKPFPSYEEVFLPIKTKQLSLGSIPIKKIDQILVDSLFPLTKLKKEQVGPASVGIQSEEGKRGLQQALISSIRLFPASYKGRVSPRSLQGCHLIARQLGDRYNPEDKRFVTREFLENDYLGVLAMEESLGNALIAFDEDWVLAGVNEYIDSKASYEVGRTEALREKIASFVPVLSAGKPIARWENYPVSTGVDIPKDKLRIYEFNETSLVNRRRNPRVIPGNKPLVSKVYMVFAPVDEREAEKIFTYLYRDVQLFSLFEHLVVKDLPLSLALDFKYLFPVELNFVSNYVIFKSDLLSRDELERAFRRNELSFRFGLLKRFH